jgi:hypothetical protein
MILGINRFSRHKTLSDAKKQFNKIIDEKVIEKGSE